MVGTWLVPSDAAEKLKSIRLSRTRVAERLDATTVRNKQCKYNSRSAARGKIRLVENRLDATSPGKSEKVYKSEATTAICKNTNPLPN